MPLSFLSEQIERMSYEDHWLRDNWLSERERQKMLLADLEAFLTQYFPEALPAFERWRAAGQA